MYFLLKSWILLFIIQYVSTKLSAQTEWYKKDDIYFYQVNTAWDFENYGIHSLMYLKDTLLIGHQLKVLRYTDKKGQHRDILIQQEGEKVRHYREFLNEFRLMYDFSAQPGDPAPISGYLIESTDTMKIHNIIRKTQIWKKENLRVLVIEGIGMIGDPAYSKLNVCSPPIPHYGCTSEVDGWDYYFRCFGTLSHTIDFPYFDPFSKCFASGTKNEEIYFQVFPNPISETFIIKSNQLFDNYSIYDQTGKLILTKVLTPTYEEVCNIDQISSLYFVQIRLGTSLLSTSKLFILSGR